VVQSVALLPSPVKGCYSAVPRIFHFCHGRAWQKAEKSSVKDKGKNRSVRVVARYTKVHIKHNILISGKFRYPANLWSRRCRISQFLLYTESQVTLGALFNNTQTMSGKQTAVQSYVASFPTVCPHRLTLSCSPFAPICSCKDLPWKNTTQDKLLLSLNKLVNTH
jgi:hypothetical protein